MQPTHSMLTCSRSKRLTRSTSLDSHDPNQGVLNAIVEEASDIEMPPAQLEVVSSSIARIDHEAGAEDSSHARVEQQMVRMMQAQAFVQVATQRDNEVPIHQAFIESEKRLTTTAQALVEAHVKEQPLETRQSLSEAIQHALVDAHSHAHQQAMQTAHDRLAQFTADIQQQIKNRLTEAVNEVGTKGVAYIEDVTMKRLALLQATTQEEIEKLVELVYQRRLALGGAQSQLVGGTNELRRQIEQLQSGLPGQLAEIEKRCHDGAVSSASAQAERIVSQAEGRLVNQVEQRLALMETNAGAAISGAVARAETHCNVLDKRMSETIERALKDLRDSRQLRTEVYVDGMLKEKLVSTINPLLEKAMETTVGSRLESKLQPIVLQHKRCSAPNSKLNLGKSWRSWSINTSTPTFIRDQLGQQLATFIERVTAVTSNTVREKLGPELRAEALSSTERLLNQQLATIIKPTVYQTVADATSRPETALDRHLRVIGEIKSPQPQPLYCAGLPAAVLHHTWPSATPLAVSPVPVDERVTRDLAQAYTPKRTGSQVQHVDLESGAVNDAKAILAARVRAKERTKSAFDARPDPDESSPLTALHAEALRNFVCEYNQYRKRGGQQVWTMFTKPEVLQYLHSVGCPEGFSDEEIFDHLKKKIVLGKSDAAELERKFAAVKIDPRANSRKEKVESILVGVESVLLEVPTMGNVRGGPRVPLATLISVVKDKLPQDLRALVERRMKFSPSPQTKREFAEILFDEAKKFRWPATTIQAANHYD